MSTETFAKTMNGASIEAQKYATNIKNGTGSSQTFATNQKVIQSSMNETSIVSQIAAAGLNLFKAALNSLIFFAVIEGIQLLIKGLDSLILTAEEAEEKAESLRNNMQSFFDEVQSGQKTISSISDRFSELNEHVTEAGENIDLTNDEYSEYLDICNQVKSIMPELISGYTNEGNAIITLKDNVDSLTESYKENIRIKAAAFVSNGDDDGNTIKSFFDDYKIFTEGEGGLFAPSAGGAWNNKSTDYEDYYGYNKVHEWLSDVADLTLEDLQNLQKGTTQATYLYALLKENGYELANITEDNYEAVHDVLNTRLTSLESEMTTRVSNIKMSLQQMLYADADYWDIDNQKALSAINSLFSDVDAEFIKQNNLLGKAALQSYESNVIKLFKNDDTQQSMIDIYTPQGQDETIVDYSKRVNDAIQKIQDYVTDKQINIPLNFNSVTNNAETLQKQYDSAIEQTKKQFEGDTSAATEALKAAQENLQDEYTKIENWGLGDYADQIKNGAIQPVFGNVDMDKRTIITWSDELKQTYQDELASWDYDPEIGTIDTVYGMSGRFGESLSDNGWEVAFTPILPDGTFLSADTVYDYIEAILQQAYADDGKVTDEELKAIDAQGMQIGDTFVKGIYAGIDDGLNYENNGNWAETVGRLMHFSGDFGAVNLAEQAIEEAKKIQEDFDWDSWFKENSINTKEEIDNWLEIAQAADSAAEARKRYVQGSTFDNETAVSFKQIISQIEALSEGLDQIDKIYADVKDKEDFDWSSLLNNDDFQETFQGCKETYDDFIKTVTSSPDDIEACQSAFNSLASEYIYNSGALNDLNDETRTATIEFLKQKGVTNAVAVVDQALMRNKIDAMFATQDFSNATYEEIQSLVEEIGVTEEATGAWNAYFVQKLLDETYSGKGDILALNNVITALDLGTVAWQRYYAAKKDMELIGSGTKKTGKSGTVYYEYEENGIKYSVSEDALKQKQDDLKKYYEEVSLELKELAEIDISYTGGTETNKSNSSSSTKSYEKDFDFFERRITVLTEALDGLSASMENVFGASAKNTIIDAEEGILTEEINNYTDAIKMYQAKADESLNKLDVSLREKIKNGAIEISEFTGENGEAVIEAMEAYAGWATKVSECSEELQNLKKQLAQLELEKFNNITEDYSSKFDLRENALSMIDKQIDLLEAAGQLVGKSFYEEKINQSNLQLENLYAERQDLANQLASALTSGRINSGSEEWLEMVKTMSDLDEEILDTKKSVEELEDVILDIKWDTFDRVQTRFDELSDELENIVGLLETATDIEVSDGHGIWTDEAIASLGVYAQQYEMAKYRVEQYADAIEDLKREYNSGKYSATEYAEKLADINSKQWDAVNSAQSMEDAIIELNKTRVNEEIDTINEAIDAYREYTESQKEALNAEKDLHDYQKTLKEKTKTITDIEKQLAAMQNDNSLSAIAKRKKLEEQLAEAKEDLAETEYEHSIESQIEALDKNFENYEQKRNDEIEALEESLKDRETLISNSLETVRENSELIGEQIESIANEHGIKISESLVASWQSGEDAIASYGDTLSSNTSEFIGELESVEQKEWELQKQANQTSEILAEAFSKKSDSLVEEFNKASTSEENLNNVTLALQNNLINTLECEYDVSGITSAMDSIASAASNAAKQLRNVREEQENADNTDGSSGRTYNLVDTRTGEILESGLSASEAKASRVKYGGKGGTAQIQYLDENNKTKVASFSNGGIVKDIEDASDGRALFKRLAQYLGEDNLVAVKNGEGILTPNQTQALVDITPTLTSDKFVTAVQKFSVPDNISRPIQNISYQYGSLITVNGNVDKDNVNEIKTLIRNELKSTLTKFDRDFRYSGY